MHQLYPKTTEREAINAQAEIHHALLLGMQLTVSMECGGEVVVTNRIHPESKMEFK